MFSIGVDMVMDAVKLIGILSTLGSTNIMSWQQEESYKQVTMYCSPLFSFVLVNYQQPVDSQHKGPVIQKMCPCQDIIILAAAMVGPNIFS